MKKKLEAGLIRKCTDAIRTAAVSGDGVASIWFLYQPKKPTDRAKVSSESKSNEKKN